MISARCGTITSGNAVTRKLEKGNGSVKGLRLLAAVDDVALIPVEVTGIAFSGGGYHDGVHVIVKPIGGHGSLTVAPLSLIDDTDDAKDLFRRKSDCALAIRLFGETKCDRQRRTKLLDMRSQLTEKQKSVFDATAEDRFGKGADMVKSIGKTSGDYELKHLFTVCANIYFGLPGAYEFEE